MAKAQTAQAIIQTVQSLAQATDSSADLVAEYWDVKNTTGDFTDADLAPIGITAAQLTACITLIENFGKLMEGETPFVTTYRATLNQVRRV